MEALTLLAVLLTLVLFFCALSVPPVRLLASWGANPDRGAEYDGAQDR